MTLNSDCTNAINGTKVDDAELHESARVAGIVLNLIVAFIAFLLALWVVWNRRAPVIKAMQPQFLVLLLVGMIMQGASIVPESVTEKNSSVDLQAVCLTGLWSGSIGTTLFHSALFSKLLRVNKIFNAGGFQRKIVTIKDVLRPLICLLAVNLILLILITILDPPVVKQELDDGDIRASSTGYCTYESGGPGPGMGNLITLVHIICLVVLCVQAYRARDIRSEFSEARGVTLSLFSRLQAMLIAVPMAILIEEDNLEAWHMLLTLTSFVPSIATLFFIFAPIISSHRQRRSSTLTGTTHVSGFADTSANRSYQENSGPKQ